MRRVSGGMRHLSFHSMSEYTRLFVVGMAAFYGMDYAGRRMLEGRELSDSQKTKIGYASQGTALAASYFVPLWVERIDTNTRNMVRDSMREANAWLGRGTVTDGQVTKLFWVAAIVAREATDCLLPFLSARPDSGDFDLGVLERSARVTSQCLEGVVACSRIITLAVKLRTPVSQEHALDLWMREELLQTHYERVGKAAESTLKKYKTFLDFVAGTGNPTRSSSIKVCEAPHFIVDSICRDLYAAQTESDKDSGDGSASLSALYAPTHSPATSQSEEVRTWRECRDRIRAHTHNTAKARTTTSLSVAAKL